MKQQQHNKPLNLAQTPSNHTYLITHIEDTTFPSRPTLPQPLPPPLPTIQRPTPTIMLPRESNLLDHFLRGADA